MIQIIDVIPEWETSISESLEIKSEDVKVSGTVLDIALPNYCSALHDFMLAPGPNFSTVSVVNFFITDELLEYYSFWSALAWGYVEPSYTC